MKVTNSYLNQSWPIAGGGIAILTIITPNPLSSDAVMALEPVIESMETWRTRLAEEVASPVKGDDERRLRRFIDPTANKVARGEPSPFHVSLGDDE